MVFISPKNLHITSKIFERLLLRPVSTLNLNRKMSSGGDDVILESVNNIGIITLNRPKALNAVNLSMVQKILPTLQEWENTQSFVLIKGAGDKAFCAGGDVRAVVEAGQKGEKLGHQFFRTEYTMNGLIGNYRIPYVALIDGIVMGGGVGLSVHGHYRICTERSLFAMPETQIGLFPDVGGSYFLPRLPGRLGYYLALTGHRLKGADIQKAGIATHYVDSRNMAHLTDELIRCKNHETIREVLDKFSVIDEKPFSLKQHQVKIDSYFAAHTMEELYFRLSEDDSEWSRKTLKTLDGMSPTSMKITLRLLQLGAQANLLECLQMEYRMAVACLANHDFYEGVRALLIDKDKNPKWNPATLEEVSSDIVANHFMKLPDSEELRHKL
ncbi:3-hydroxyisobutyryl-CoA hydrolase, mitochondrial isoform X1 [Onthophagus taurus]|uniref:3-hydroxyisobutyryl-CoA hydrolase, mitochondrial isoform X1 n=2 Tax=Onthophagus taurus TaxID=166361 RepID=UPI0039BE181B